MPSEASFGIIPLRRCKSGWEVLLIQHRSGGHWAFPKGHAEAGESPLQTAIRELAEETGLSLIRLIQEAPLVEQYHFTRNGIPIDKTVMYFLAEVGNGEIRLQDAELIHYQWVPIEQASEIVTFPQAKSLCKEIIKRSQESEAGRQNPSEEL